MLTEHLNDDEIQQYALDRSHCVTKIVEHVLLCEDCKARVATYQFLFASIKEQPEPVFDFDLSELVLTKLPASNPKGLPESFFIYLTVLAGMALGGTVLYLYRGYVDSLFAGIAPLITYLILTTFITVIIAFSIDMYKNYQKKMKVLDFY